MGLIGHNGGPTMAPGTSWRTHCWRHARTALLPTLPIEVLRNRVARAKELGLDYRTYASVRAQTGRDVVAFLFSSNALRTSARQPAMPAPQEAKLALIGAARIGLAVRPLDPVAMHRANPVLDAAHPAPWALAGWSETRALLRAALDRLPGDGVLLVGDYRAEAEWCAPARLAGFLTAAQYFGTQA